MTCAHSGHADSSNVRKGVAVYIHRCEPSAFTLPLPGSELLNFGASLESSGPPAFFDM